MKKAVLLAAILSLGIAPSHADHGETLSVTGTIKAPSPLSWAYFVGLTESSNPCGEPDRDLGDLQGVDGWWIALPVDLDEELSLVAGHNAVLTTTSTTAADLDVWWYDLACGFIGTSRSPHSHDMATHPFGGTIPDVDAPYYPYPGAEQNMSPNEEGIVPNEAAFAVVNLVAGANVDFTFTIEA